MNNIIDVKNLSKSFDGLKAIDDLTFSVQSGEIFAFLGANGSGKTTTIRCLLNIYKADSGISLIKGIPYTSEVSKIVGYLPEERGLYTDSTVLETIIYFGQLKGTSYFDSKMRAKKYLKMLEIEDKAYEKIKKLSSGQQQKVQLITTLINNPEILILDEPTKGLDPVNRKLLMNLLFDLNKDKGVTILFSTHQMEEVERITKRLLMIKKGKSILYGNVEDIKQSFGDNTIRIEFNGKFVKNPQLFSSTVETNQAVIVPNKDVSTKDVLKFLANENIEILKFAKTYPSLEEIFIKVSK